MNRFSVIAVALVSCWLFVWKLLAASSEIEKARQYGAKGAVTLHITDSIGKPVEKARISACFFPSDSYADADGREGHTDTNGCFYLEGKTVDDLAYEVTKDSSYKTIGKYWFYRRGENCVQDGRWQPWNPTNTVVLKEIRHPIPMCSKRVDAPVPIQGAHVGYDLEVGDWVAPYGQGKQTDMLVTYEATIKAPLVFSNQLTIASSNKMDGFIRINKDKWSFFPSVYEAPTNGYRSLLVLTLDRTQEHILKKAQFTESEYLIFRMRTVLDNKGNIISARYGKIYGPIEYGELDKDRGGVRFTYYLNPTPNDRNVEFDPKQNLFTNLKSTEQVTDP